MKVFWRLKTAINCTWHEGDLVLREGNMLKLAETEYSKGNKP